MEVIKQYMHNLTTQANNFYHHYHLSFNPMSAKTMVQTFRTYKQHSSWHIWVSIDIQGKKNGKKMKRQSWFQTWITKRMVLCTQFILFEKCMQVCAQIHKHLLRNLKTHNWHIALLVRKYSAYLFQKGGENKIITHCLFWIHD